MSGSRRERLMLLDGYSLAYRAHHAMYDRPLRTTRGENTTVPWGITRLLRKLLQEHAPEYAAFVLDAPGGATFRLALYSAYKATRERAGAALEPGEFDVAMGRVRQLLDAFRIPVVEVGGYEADDVIGTMAVEAARRDLDAVIVSSDTDFYQLVGEHVFVLEPGRSGRSYIEPRWVDRAAATARMGVPPEHVVDLLALVGDPSDNVPGVRGIGAKTAHALLEKYGALDAILEHAHEIGGKRAREALQRAGDVARMSQDLVTIRTDVPVHLELDALRVRDPDRDRLRELFVELEFNTLLHELTPARPEQARWRVVTTPAEADALGRRVRDGGRVALAVLADGELPGSARLVGVAVALEEGGARYLPFGHAGCANLPSLGSPALAEFASALSTPEVMLVADDVQRTLEVLRSARVEVHGRVASPATLAHSLDPARRALDLESLVMEKLGHRLERRPAAPSASELSLDAAGRWACERAEAVLRLCSRLESELGARGGLHVYGQVDAPLLPLLADIEWAGLPVETSALDDLGDRLAARAEALRREIDALAGGGLNPDSPAQLRDALFGHLHLPIKKRTRTGPSTDAEVLAELAEEGYALPAKILELRETSNLLGPQLAAVRARVDPTTGRLHPRLSRTASSDERVWMTEPALETVAARSELGAAVRAAVVASEGRLLLSAGYSQLELRLLAHLSGEAALLAAFREGRDPHVATAALLFAVPPGSVTRPMRDTARVLNEEAIRVEGLGILAQRLDMGLNDADALFELYRLRLPAIQAWLDGQLRRAERDGYVETVLGRRREVPELRMVGHEVRAAGGRAAQRSPVQGSAADLMALAAVRVHARVRAQRLRSRVLLVIGDELVLDAAGDEVAEVGRLVRAEMEHVAALDVPLVAIVGVGRRWLEATADRDASETRPAEERELRP